MAYEFESHRPHYIYERTNDMPAKILDGKKIADEILSSLAAMNEAEDDMIPRLAILSIGNDPASDVYIKNKMSACKRCGFACEIVSMPRYDRSKARSVINGWNHDYETHGIIVQLPVPPEAEEHMSYMDVRSDKDVDGFMSYSPKFSPCTPAGIMRLLEEVYLPHELAGKNAVVIGRSEIVGKPMAQMLLNLDCTVTVCHSKTQNLAEHTRCADIVIAAAGVPGLITGDMIKPGAVVIDVGINRVNGKLVGDVDFDSAKEVAGWITPVPGGVGPMTVAMLMNNVWQAAHS